MDQSSFGNSLAKNTQLSVSGPYVKTHEWEVEYMNFTQGENFFAYKYHLNCSGPTYSRFLARLVYQPKSLIQSCFVHHHWRRRWHLCTPPPGTGLYIETLYLVYHVSHWDWKTGKTWKNGKTFSSQGKVREFCQDRKSHI